MSGHPPRVSPEKRKAVMRLRRAGFSQKRIARELRMSEETVFYVINGRWRYQPAGESGFKFPNLEGMPVRCPQCGAKVYMPCLACTLENRKRKAK